MAITTDHCNNLISENIGSIHLCLEKCGRCTVMQWSIRKEHEGSISVIPRIPSSTIVSAQRWLQINPDCYEDSLTWHLSFHLCFALRKPLWEYISSHNLTIKKEWAVQHDHSHQYKCSRQLGNSFSDNHSPWELMLFFCTNTRAEGSATLYSLHKYNAPASLLLSSNPWHHNSHP